MKLTIFGATGRTGKYLLEQALEAGYEVTVLVRSAEKITAESPNLTIIQGDARDAEKVDRAIRRAEAVLVTLGPVRGGPMDVMAKAAANIVSSMKAHNVKRVVFTTGAGVPAPEDQPNLMNKLMGFLVKTLSRQVYQDSLRGVQIIQDSGLDWTIARGPMLRDAPYNGSYQVGYVGVNMSGTLSRGNFAHFVLEQVDDLSYLHKIPAISDIG
jgi:putative NADH-flavin reductase